MNAIFLRGSIPHEHPEKLLYDRIENCEDVWIQLFYGLLQALGARGELLYQGGKKKFVVGKTFTEKWVASFKKYTPPFAPDLIMCRGGFPYYDHIVKKFPKAIKIYYGAGKRFYPQTNFIDYDLFLVDSLKQLRAVRKKGRRVALFVKPAATLFKKIDVKKKYDVCYMANATQARIKRHKLFLESFAHSEFKILNLGNTDKKLISLAKKLQVKIDWGGWSLRSKLPDRIAQCRVGVCCSTNYDSCPRVIPEYLACGLPVVATKNMNFWHNKYITPETGVLVGDGGIESGVRKLLSRRLTPESYYNKHLSVGKAAKYLAELIKAVS